MISCILLSAGLSSRFGSPKALAKVNDHMLLEQTQYMLLESNLHDIIIVLGADAKRIEPFVLNHKRIKLVYNKDYNFGQTSSFQAGLKNISKISSGVMLLPIDYPVIKTETINGLISYYKKKHPKVIIPSFKGKKGHPPLFNIKLKNEFLKLDKSKGLNTVSYHHNDNTIILPLNDPGITYTFNTQEELNKIEFFVNGKN